MSFLLRLPTPFPSNFKTLFSSRIRLRAVIDVIVLLADRCDLGHQNPNRLHAHGSACTLVAAKQDVALGYVLRATDEHGRASMRVQAIGVFVSYVTATGY